MTTTKAPETGVAVGFVKVFAKSTTRLELPVVGFILTLEEPAKRLEFHDAKTMFDNPSPGGTEYFTIIRREDGVEEEHPGASSGDKVGDRYKKRFCACGESSWSRAERGDDASVTPDQYECPSCQMR